MKKLLVLLLTATLLISSAACANNTSATVLESGVTSKSSDTSKTDVTSKKSITIWIEKVFSEDANAAVEARLNAFSKETGITVNYEFIAATDFMTKLNAAIEAGTNVPDITTAAVTKVLNYYPNIPYSDVSDLVNNINSKRPYLDSIYEGAKIDNKYYFVPFTSSTSLMYVRTDVLKEKGLEIPTTWDEVFNVAEKVSDPANGFYGLGMGCGPKDEDGENTFRTIMCNEGANIFDKDGNVTINSDKAIELLNTYKKLYDEGCIPPAASTWDSSGNNSSYLMGESAIVFNAPTLYNAMLNDPAYKDLLANTAVVAPPKGSVNDIKIGFATGFSIMNTCKDTESATSLINYMLDKDWYNQYIEITAPVFAPLFKDNTESGSWTEGVNAQVLNYAESASSYYGYPVVSLKGRAIAAKHYFTFPIVEIMNKVVTGAASPKEALAAAETKIADIQSTIK